MQIKRDVAVKALQLCEEVAAGALALSLRDRQPEARAVGMTWTVYRG